MTVLDKKLLTRQLRLCAILLLALLTLQVGIGAFSTGAPLRGAITTLLAAANVIAVVSATVVFASIRHRSEHIPFLCTGYSSYRIIAPCISCGFVISITSLLLAQLDAGSLASHGFDSGLASHPLWSICEIVFSPLAYVIAFAQVYRRDSVSPPAASIIWALGVLCILYGITAFSFSAMRTSAWPSSVVILVVMSIWVFASIALAMRVET